MTLRPEIRENHASAASFCAYLQPPQRDNFIKLLVRGSNNEASDF